jgi:hypothetical protein
MKAVQPFLAVVPTTSRPFVSSLPTIETEVAQTPWSPKPVDAKPPSTNASADDLAERRATARAEGRAEGLRETEALRARLTELVVALSKARDAMVEPTSELVADLAVCVVESWLDAVPRRDVFARVVRAWLAHSDATDTVVHVHPSDVAAVTAAVAETTVSAVADTSVAPGELRLRGGALELYHSPRARIGELRTALVAALGESNP